MSFIVFLHCFLNLEPEVLGGFGDDIKTPDTDVGRYDVSQSNSHKSFVLVYNNL